jgi:ABC-type lipoprotein export system ATPase subunit
MIEIEGVSKVFRTRRGDVRALDDLHLRAGRGEFLVIRGASGSGKTTLLLAVGGMQHPTSGAVRVDGRDVYRLSTRDRARFRAENIGFVFQLFHLVPYLSVLENALLPARAGGLHPSRHEAADLLERFGLAPRAHHRPAELSAGERQRAAIARALLNRPKVILADEPTGNLDPENAAQIMAGLVSFHRDGGTLMLVTHGTVADAHADRIIRLRAGRLDETAAVPAAIR